MMEPRKKPSDIYPTAFLFVKSGEPDATRTHDPRLKRALLYQLSYGPTKNERVIISLYRSGVNAFQHVVS